MYHYSLGLKNIVCYCRLSKAEIDREIAAAFQLWADVSSLNFEARRTGSVHIDIR